MQSQYPKKWTPSWLGWTDYYTFVYCLYGSTARVDWLLYICLLLVWQHGWGGLIAIHLSLICMAARLGWTWLPYICLSFVWQWGLGGLTAIQLSLICMTVRLGWTDCHTYLSYLYRSKAWGTDCHTFVSYLHGSTAWVGWLPYICLLFVWQHGWDGLTAIHLFVCCCWGFFWGGRGVELHVSAILYVFGQQLHCHSRIGVGVDSW